MTRGDRLIERAADRLEELAGRAAAEGGFKARLAEPLADDADLLRGMRPSLIAARLRGKPGTDGDRAAGRTPPPVPSTPDPEPRRGKEPGHGPNPIAVVAAAFVLGLLLAKVVDWRSHAHPRE